MSKLFSLEVDRGIPTSDEWFCTLWYNGNDPLTDVHVLIDGDEGITYSVLPPNRTKAVLRWTCGSKAVMTVDVQWNNGRQVLSSSQRTENMEIIRLELEPDAFRVLLNTKPPEETLDAAIEKFVRIGLKAKMKNDLKNQIFTDRFYVTLLLFDHQFNLDGNLKTQIRRIYRKHADAKSNYTLGDYAVHVKLPPTEIHVFKKDLICILEDHVDRLIKQESKQ